MIQQFKRISVILQSSIIDIQVNQQNLMNNNKQSISQFEDAYNAYLNLKNSKIIPAKIDLKLNLLSKCIKQCKIQQSEFQIELEQFKQLTAITKQEQIMLFISIIDCVRDKQKPSDPIKAYFRKDKYITLWEICYIIVDNNIINLLKKTKLTYNIREIRISNQIKKKLGKYAFSISTENKKYYIGFSKQSIAKEVYIKIKNFAAAHPDNENPLKYYETINTYFNNVITQENQKKQQKMGITQENEKKQQKVAITQENEKKQQKGDNNIQQLQNQLIVDSLQKTDISEDKNKQISPYNQQEQLQIEQYQENSEDSNKNQFKLLDIQNDDQFKIFENVQNGRILYSDKRPNLTKISIVIQNSDYQNVLFMFSNIKEWNPEIIKSTIVTKLDNNLFVIYQHHKSYNYNSRSRDFLFIRKAQKINNAYFVLDKSVSHVNYPQYKSIVRANIVERITVFVPHPENSNLMLLICKMQIDYRGYNNQQDNINMGVNNLKKFLYFNAYCIQKSFITLKKAPCTNIFNFEVKKKKKITKIQALPIKQILKPELIIEQKKQQEQQCTKQEIIEVISPQNQQESLINFMPLYEEDQISQKYIEEIQKLKHHLLPLNHFHQQNVRHQFTPKRSIEQSKNFIFQNNNWILDSESQFNFINNKILQIQGNVAKMVLKKLGANILYGRSIMNMSLPVDIFEKRGLLQRSANSFGYAPIYLTQAGKIQNHLEQMKLIIQFILTINLLQLSIEKPFNPILGQTFQCYLANIPLCYQQISHHPPISGYYMKGNQFLMYGNLSSYAQIKFNGGVGGNSSPMHIKFGINNSHYQCSIPPGQMVGLLYGQRKFRVTGKIFILNQDEQLFTQISFGKSKKQLYPSSVAMRKSDIAGGIFKVTSDFIDKYKNCSNKHKFEGLNKKDVIQKYSSIQGTWSDKIIIDDKVVKTLLDPIPYKIQYEKYPLPSNSNYREDIIYLKMRNLEKSQDSKQKLQIIQRKDKSLRSSTKH